MQNFMINLQVKVEDQVSYQCPLKSEHKLDSLEQLINHLCVCERDPNEKVKRFICRFNHFHWFSTQQVNWFNKAQIVKKRVMHETFYCNNRNSSLAHNEIIINGNNEVLLPLEGIDEKSVRDYFQFGNCQSHPDYSNFFHQFEKQEEEVVKRIEIERSNILRLEKPCRKKQKENIIKQFENQ